MSFTSCVPIASTTTPIPAPTTSARPAAIRSPGGSTIPSMPVATAPIPTSESANVDFICASMHAMLAGSAG